MNKITCKATSLDGVWVLDPPRDYDERGRFGETYHEQKFSDLGIPGRFVQDNQSFSKSNVLRGLHYQLAHPQAKLCRVLQGEVLDVAVDIRMGSPTFGHWVGVHLSAVNNWQLYIPRGFAHGFVVLSDTADVLYKCDDFYYQDDEYGVAWNDPALGIQWEIDRPILSAKDAAHPPLSAIPTSALPRYEP